MILLFKRDWVCPYKFRRVNIKIDIQVGRTGAMTPVAKIKPVQEVF